MSTLLSELPYPEVINLDLQARTAAEAIQELHSGLVESEAIRDAAGLLGDLLARQALCNNCLDAELALAHARTAAVSRFVLAVGRSEQGIRFAREQPAIRLVIMIAIPVESVSEYLRVIAQLTRTLRGVPLRQSLLAVRSPDEFRLAWPLDPPRPTSGTGTRSTDSVGSS